jgi:U3 small nucleolar ribonucleoprotein protein LCP5
MLNCSVRRQIRPIDKKMEYQIQKLTNAADSAAAAQDKVPDAQPVQQQGEEDLLRYRPNPDMMDTKLATDGQVCVFCANLYLYCRL